ncbi:hypothetical protein HD806DRAFT_412263 [Xylariaceae sp. AK1471]|nr:hypothetical protein HD806DRAFT_412263 [Xylariaceae sp. AK1471]
MTPSSALPSCSLLSMSPDKFQRHLATKPIKFIVGSDKVEFYIHGAFLSRLSTPLGSLVDGGINASLEACVTWEDVDKDVFLRFAQFAYTDNYASFAPVDKYDPARCFEGATRPMANTIEPDRNSPRESAFSAADTIVQPVNVEDAFKLPYSLMSYKMIADRTHSLYCKYSRASRVSRLEYYAMACDCSAKGEGSPSKKKQDYISTFIAKQGDLAHDDSVDGWQNVWQTKQVSQTKSFEYVFTGHAGVGALAERCGIASLVDLACSYLVYELSQWTISTSVFVPEFGGLVRYVYGHTAQGCRLRLLVAQFAACVVEDVCGLEGWSALLHDMPDFVTDLVNQLTSRFG